MLPNNFEWETVDWRQLYTEDGTQTHESTTRMDIALLEKQYNWNKEKQKKETRVVVFKTASTNEELARKSLVNVVPMHREINRRSLQRQLSISEDHSDFFMDHGSSLWRTHLGLHREGTTVFGDGSCHKQYSSVIPNSLFRDSSLESTESSDKLTSDPEELDSSMSLGSSASAQEMEDHKPSRKFSAPSVLSSQPSLVRRHPSQTHSTARHYPFPQLKGPRKSEAARRLGMYTSF